MGLVCATTVLCSPQSKGGHRDQPLSAVRQETPEERLFAEICAQDECYRHYLVSARLDNSGQALAHVKVVEYFNLGEPIFKERVGSHIPKPNPPIYQAVKLSCRKRGSFVQYANSSRIAEPDRKPNRTTMAAYHLWVAVCERRFPRPGSESNFEVR